MATLPPRPALPLSNRSFSPPDVPHENYSEGQIFSSFLRPFNSQQTHFFFLNLSALPEPVGGVKRISEALWGLFFFLAMLPGEIKPPYIIPPARPSSSPRFLRPPMAQPFVTI